MNILHRRYCRSEEWRQAVHHGMMPWVLGEIEPGERVLEIGPGPGVTTDWLRERVPALTCIEIDHSLAEALKARLEGTNVTVVEGDATEMTFPDVSFDSAVCFTMLHHVPARALQDRLLAEAHRVLKPGGLFLGSDSRTSFRFRLFHVFDTCLPVEPDGFPARLEAAGGSRTFRSRSDLSTTPSNSARGRAETSGWGPIRTDRPSGLSASAPWKHSGAWLVGVGSQLAG